MAGKVPAIQGKQYTNRTDLQNSANRQPQAPARAAKPPRSPGGNPMGVAPLGLQPTPPQVSVPQPAGPPPGAPQPDYSMESVPNVTDPSARPNESVLTGASYGFQPDSAGDSLALRMRSAYLADPDPALAELIMGLDATADRIDTQEPSTNMWPGGPRFFGVI